MSFAAPLLSASRFNDDVALAPMSKLIVPSPTPSTKVLLIDDDHFTFQVVADGLATLQNHRYEVSWQSGYRGGLHALLDEPAVDVCLLDYQLDGRTGLELLREAIERGCRVPIVMLTSHDDSKIDLEALRAGAADYLVKGQLDPRVIQRCLRYAIERSSALDAIRENEERYAQVVAGANDGLWDWKLEDNQVYFSPRWKEILGYSDRELPNQIEQWYARVHKEDVETLQARLADHLSGLVEHFECVHRILHKDGTYRWVQTRGLATRRADGVPTRLAGSQRDVTQTVGHDPLTGLPNRLLFLDRLGRVLERARRHRSYAYATLLVDLDRFTLINNSMGHGLGDELLVAVASRLATCVRMADTLARIGGDEFAMLLEDVTTPTDALQVAARIEKAMEQPLLLGGRDVFVSASIGVALGAERYDRPDELLRDADTALYRAKAGGRGRHALFDQAMHAKILERVQLESDLRRALDGGELRLSYQPIYSLPNNSLGGLEALVRWQHPRRGLVAPSEFIPLAEEVGFIAQIDRWVLRTACAQVAAWRKQRPDLPGFTVSCNASKGFLQRGDLLATVDQILTESGLPPSALVLEVTEGTLLDDTDRVRAMMIALRGLGVGLAMDDFGTGYSSLSYLHRLPFTVLKIDRSFVERLGAPEDSREIVRTIIMLARAMHLPVTAEGVESPEQRECLRELGCDSVQGFLLSKPLTAKGLEALLAEAPR